MIRFQHQTKLRKPPVVLVSLALFILIIFLFLSGLNMVSAGSVDRQKEILSASISRIISFCYANEGSYPESLDYMKEQYGLTYDESIFFVDMISQGSNMYPDVTIIVK